MTDDRALRDRLSNLASAVPVRPSSPAAMVRRPVRLGPAFRPASGRSWVLVALVGVLFVAAMGILGSGGQPAYGPVVETVRQGDFELTLRADKGRYAPGEPIKIAASLTYRGSEAEVQVVHGGGTGGSPVVFVIREPVFGATLDGIWEASRNRTALARDAALDVPFAKSGGWLSPPPEPFQEWLAEPGLWLPSGTWHIAAIADFSVDDVEAFKLEAEIAITVESPSPTGLTQPSPSEEENLPQSTTVRDGEFELTIRSSKTRYTTDEVLDVSASLVYRGTEAEARVGHGLGASGSPIVFGIREPVFGASLNGLWASSRNLTTLAQGVPLTAPFAKSGGWVSPPPDEFQAWLDEPELRLPTGTWHIWARAEFSDERDRFFPSLTAEIAIVVSDDPAATAAPPPTPSPYEPIGLPIGDDQQDGPWQVALWSPRQQYREGDKIEVFLELGYWGEAPWIETYGSGSGRLYYGIRQLGGTGGETIGLRADCTPQGRVEQAGENRLPIPIRLPTLAPAGLLSLPAGTWEFWAETAFGTSPDCTGGPTIHASITLVVRP